MRGIPRRFKDMSPWVEHPRGALRLAGIDDSRPVFPRNCIWATPCRVNFRDLSAVRQSALRLPAVRLGFGDLHEDQ